MPGPRIVARLDIGTQMAARLAGELRRKFRAPHAIAGLSLDPGMFALTTRGDGPPQGGRFADRTSPLMTSVQCRSISSSANLSFRSSFTNELAFTFAALST